MHGPPQCFQWSDSKLCSMALALFPNADNITSDSVSASKYDHPSKAEPQLHPAMKKLAVLGVQARECHGSMVDILHRLTAPNLDHLSFANFCVWDAQTTLRPFMGRSSCRPRTLVLDNLRLRPWSRSCACCRPWKASSSPSCCQNSVTDLIWRPSTRSPHMCFSQR
ncbi:hypothetical protein DFH09DRAFT_162781 [Mycena vulgaris]|nr:hypothetical protein DFH09DRAFT_162781 [Mycena vulgaris]